MNKKNIMYVVSFIILLVLAILIIGFSRSKNEKSSTSTNTIETTVLAVNSGKLTVQDQNHIIYTFDMQDIDKSVDVGDHIMIKYTGLLDKNKELQNIVVVDYSDSSPSLDEDGVPNDLLDDGIFSDYYTLAYNKLKELSLDEKIGQLLLVRYPDTQILEDLEKYKFGGYVFFEKDFKDKIEIEVKDMITQLQKVSNIPLLTAVDEEGGKVVRVSSNLNLVKERFKSSQELYQLGGFDLIEQDTKEKSRVLNNLGLNLNLAPVVDVSTDPNDYMYERSLGKNTELTKEYSKIVIESSKGTGVSYTLKHFPGYGNNQDTHTGGSIDQRSYEDIVNNDLPPFEAGIEAGAEAVLVSHNTVTSIDPNNPASLSPSVHNLLRNKMTFTGIIITDDLAMGATSSINNATIKAILAGNDMIITTDYKESFNSIKNAIENGTISENTIDRLAFRVIAWKYYKGLMFEAYK